jgi:prophage regulatory protein
VISLSVAHTLGSSNNEGDPTMNHIPTTGYLRLSQIIGQAEVSEAQAAQNRLEAKAAIERGEKPNNKPKRARRALPALIPIGKSKWWAGVAAGTYPKPTKALGPRTTVWRVEDIHVLLAKSGA